MSNELPKFDLRKLPYSPVKNPLVDGVTIKTKQKQVRVGGVREMTDMTTGEVSQAVIVEELEAVQSGGQRARVDHQPLAPERPRLLPGRRLARDLFGHQRGLFVSARRASVPVAELAQRFGHPQPREPFGQRFAQTALAGALGADDRDAHGRAGGGPLRDRARARTADLAHGCTARRLRRQRRSPASESSMNSPYSTAVSHSAL